VEEEEGGGGGGWIGESGVGIRTGTKQDRVGEGRVRGYIVRE
jgi:hypothetical protein